MADTFEADPSRVASVFGSILSAIGGFADPAEAAQMTGTSTSPTDTALSTAPPTLPTTGDTGTSLTFPAAQQYGVNSAFGPRGKGFHPGVDLALPDHTQVLSAMSGTVIEAVNSDDPHAYNVVKIQGAGGIVTEYGHLSGVNVNVGDTVKQGQMIGMSGGAPGERGAYNADGPHLHFQVDVNGQPVDPMSMLAGGAPIVADAQGNPLPPTAIRIRSPQDIMGAQLGNVAAAISGSGETRDVSKPLEQDTSSGTTTGESTLSGAMSGADGDPNAINAFLAAVRQHESGGNYQSRDRSGLSDASGAYGFLNSTFKAYGGSGNAYQASPGAQDAAARAMATELFNRYHSWYWVGIAWYGGPGVADQMRAGRGEPAVPGNQPPYHTMGDYVRNFMAGGG